MATGARRSCRLLLNAVLLAAAAGGPAAAQPAGPAVDGFSGFVTLLTGYVSVKSQFSTDGENRETSSLNSSGQTVDSVVVAPLFEVAYAVSDWRTQVYLGLPIENIREGTFFQQEVGVRHWLADGTRLTAAFLPWPVIAQKTWQDPFVVDEGRKRTDVDALGVKLDAERIAGSNFGLRYRFVHRSIDDEDSGEFLSGLPGSTLTDGDIRDLRRDADTHEGTLSYAYPLGRGLLLRPALRYTYADAEGGANSFQAVRPELGVLFRTPKYDASANLSYARSWFNEDNPIYGEKRDSNDYGAVLLFGYREPFGLRRVRAELVGAVNLADSEINFYDARVMFIGAGATYSF
jgi:hypothetical protein